MARRDLAEIGPFRKPAAQDAVAVFHAALLIGGVGSGVEDLRPEGSVEGGLVEKLAAVVRDDAADSSDALGGPHAADGADDAFLVDADELLEAVAARKPVVDDEDAAAAAGARDDRVALYVSGRGRGDGLGGELLKLAPSQDGPGRVGRIALALVLAAVGQVVVRQADVAGLDVVVERAKRGKRRVGKLLPDDHQRVVDRAMPVGLLDQVPNAVRDRLEQLLPRPLLGGALVGPLLRQLRIVAAVEPAVRETQIPDGLGSSAQPVFPAPGRFGNVHPPGEVPERELGVQRLDPAVPLARQMDPVDFDEVFPFVLGYGILRAHVLSFCWLGCLKRIPCYRKGRTFSMSPPCPPGRGRPRGAAPSRGRRVGRPSPWRTRPGVRHYILQLSTPAGLANDLAKPPALAYTPAPLATPFPP